MAKRQTKKASRKRRSFFEPESKVLSEWLAQQNDLGVSLQLIIVDAIRNYGDGDVIQAFLTARESVPGEPRVTASETLDGIQQTAKQPKATPKAAPVPIAKEEEEAAPKVKTPKPEATPETRILMPVVESPQPVPVEPKAEPVKPLTAPVKPAAKAPTPEPEDAPLDASDPLAVMFGDIESNYSGS